MYSVYIEKETVCAVEPMARVLPQAVSYQEISRSLAIADKGFAAIHDFKNSLGVLGCFPCRQEETI